MNEDLEFQLSNLVGSIWILCGIAFLFIHPLIGFGLIALWLAGLAIVGIFSSIKRNAKEGNWIAAIWIAFLVLFFGYGAIGNLVKMF